MLSGEVEFDDAYIGATKIGSKRGRGTSKAPFVVAVELGKKGGCCLRATGDLKAVSYKAFAHDHICKNSHIRTDDFPSLKCGLATWPGLDAQKFDAVGEESALRHVHNIISNLKSYIIRTYHGVHREYLQSYLDEFQYRYCKRHDRGIFTTLIADMCRGKTPRAQLIELFATQEIQVAA